jgi:hypothetical protein
VGDDVVAPDHGSEKRAQAEQDQRQCCAAERERQRVSRHRAIRAEVVRQVRRQLGDDVRARTPGSVPDRRGRVVQCRLERDQDRIADLAQVVAYARPSGGADIADVVDERRPDQVGKTAQVDVDVDRTWL